MAHPLDGVGLKLAEADKHFAVLDRERSSFLKSGGNRVVGQLDADGRNYVFRIVGEPPPLAWGIHVSGFAHFLRTALENTIVQVVKARGGKTNRDHGFPICEHRSQFIRQSKLYPGLTIGQVMTRGVSADDFAFIEQSQPYHAGDGARWHPLALLAHLNNVDKHRYVHPSRVGGAFLMPHPRMAPDKPFPMVPLLFGDKRPEPMDGSQVLIFRRPGFRSPNRSVSFTKFRYGPGREDDSTEIARVIGVTVHGPDPQVEMQPSPIVEISFSDRKRMTHIADLFDIRERVHEAVGYFRDRIA